MVTVRLFGPARELFGAPICTLQATALDTVRDELAVRGGPSFAALLARSVLWVNGEPAGADATLSADDEVAVLPPVSGGC